MLGKLGINVLAIVAITVLPMNTFACYFNYFQTYFYYRIAIKVPLLKKDNDCPLEHRPITTVCFT